MKQPNATFPGRWLAGLSAGVVFAALGAAQGQAASEVPSAEFLGVPSFFDCTGGNYNVPTQYNLPSLVRVAGSLVVDGLGEVSSYDQEGSRTDLGTYNFNTGPFSVPSGTLFTATLITYAGPQPSEEEAYRSELVFECGTGTLVSLASGVPEPEEVPLLPHWALGALAALLGGAGAWRARRRAARA
ncbi:IPTL-CTERM sorting domain-containing protein [Mangrovimicrobium sediminis]|nr:IPTL-CTERM sorting domain-containing protein [Haliea sp. SAOS-164]